jgi:hypothetical protein
MFYGQYVTKFFKYLNKHYVDHKNIHPCDWLHLGLKEYYYYDATNNTSESLNRALKRNEILPFSLKKSIKKILAVIKRYCHIFLYELSSDTSYNHSEKKAINLKNKRMEKFLERSESIVKDYSLDDYK